MDANQETERTQTDKQREAAVGESSSAEQRRSSTSPPGGRTETATSPPGQGDVDEDAVKKGWDGLDRAGGGH